MNKTSTVLVICRILRDGYAIKNILPKYNIIPVIITGRESQIVQNRCVELGIHYLYQGISQKEEKLKDLLEELHLTYENVYYIGDDLNDINCMKKAKFSGCPKDAAEEAKKVSDFVSSYNRGNGAVREFIEWLICTY